MSRFIDSLKKPSRSASQSIGFRATPSASPEPKIQLAASIAQESVESLADYLAGADAGLLRISNLSSGAQSLQKISQAVPDIPWGVWLQGTEPGEIHHLTGISCDFAVFPATNTPLALPPNDEIGRILEVEASLNEGLLRAANELPVDAVLIAGEQREDYFLTWQHLMLFRRFADLLTKPLLVSTPSNVTASELQALWEAGVEGVVVAVTVGQPQDRLGELRQVIDRLTFPSSRRREKLEPLLPRISQESNIATMEEDEEE